MTGSICHRCHATISGVRGLDAGTLNMLHMLQCIRTQVQALPPHLQVICFTSGAAGLQMFLSPPFPLNFCFYQINQYNEIRMNFILGKVQASSQRLKQKCLSYNVSQTKDSYQLSWQRLNALTSHTFRCVITLLICILGCWKSGVQVVVDLNPLF